MSSGLVGPTFQAVKIFSQSVLTAIDQEPWNIESLLAISCSLIITSKVQDSVFAGKLCEDLLVVSKWRVDRIIYNRLPKLPPSQCADEGLKHSRLWYRKNKVK